MVRLRRGDDLGRTGVLTRHSAERNNVPAVFALAVQQGEVVPALGDLDCDGRPDARRCIRRERRSAAVLVESASCHWRGRLLSVLVMVPNAELVGPVFGAAKFEWFHAL